MSSRRGGPGTIHGIVYQLLWSLLRAAKVHVATDFSADLTSGTKATIILEPECGGGDIQELTNNGRVIQQIKVGGHSWSLVSIVHEVLPDLYKAVDLKQQSDAFQFITDGWMGDWKGVSTFFRSLSLVPCPQGDASLALDDSKPIRFRYEQSGDHPFSGKATVTARDLFNWIVDTLQQVPSIQELKEPIDVVHRKAWQLLGHFEFVSRQTESTIIAQIDRLLLEIVVKSSDIKRTRDALLMSLGHKAGAGNTEIVAAEFFQEHGLNSVPLSHWTSIVRNSASRVTRRLSVLGYSEQDDVRTFPVFNDWPEKVRLLALKGESGQGKSWMLYNLAKMRAETDLVVLISSDDDWKVDLQLAASEFAAIVDREDQSLDRIATRLRQIGSPNHGRWLYLFIDDLKDAATAKKLAQQVDWEGLGVRLVVAGHPDAIRTFMHVSGDRAIDFSVPNFTTEELVQYLTAGDLERFYRIHSDVLEILHRPLLARLYRQHVHDSDWDPKNEYELYDRAWEDAFLTADDEERLAEAPLMELALDVYAGGVYPWTITQMASLGKDGMKFLLHEGVLQEVEPGKYQIWHDRIRDWLIAKALVDRWRLGTLSDSELKQQITEVWRQPNTEFARHFGYVPMNVLWLLCQEHSVPEDLLTDVLHEIEHLDPHDGRYFYTETLPPLGAAIASCVARRIEEIAKEKDWGQIIGPHAQCLATFPATITTPICLRFLQVGGLTRLHASCEILQRRPAVEALGPLLDVLFDIEQNRAKYQPANTGWAIAAVLQEACENALIACAQLDPDWVERQIMASERDSKTLMLVAYALPKLSDARERCARCREKLKQLLTPQHQRVIAEFAYQYPDPSEAGWLQTNLSRVEGNLGAMCLRALMRVDAEAASSAFAELPEEHLQGTRFWTLRPLLLRKPDAVKQKCLEMLRSAAEPLDVLEAFQGFEDELTAEHLNLALNALEIKLEGASQQSGREESRVWRTLGSLGAANSLEALTCLQKRRNTPLESKLAEWLLLRGPRPTIYEDHNLSAGVEVLYRIGGNGFNRVVESWLSSGMHFGIIDGCCIAYKRPTISTLSLLEQIACIEQADHDQLFQLRLAMRALARAAAWEPMIRAVVAAGFNTPQDVCYCAFGHEPFDDAILRPALEVISDGQVEQKPGCILALAIAQRADMEPIIADHLYQSAPGSDTEQACILALSLLKTQEDRTAELIYTRRKQVKLDIEFSEEALLKNHSSAAHRLLNEQLSETWDTRIALTLFSRGAEVENIGSRLREHIEHLLASHHPHTAGELDQIYGAIKGKQEADDMLSPSIVTALRDLAFAPEGTFWVVGSKVSFIRLLSLADDGTAYTAALRSLKDKRAHDRSLYPELLFTIDQDEAWNDLSTHIPQEEDEEVRAAIARAFCKRGNSGLLMHWLSDPSSALRRAGCALAGHQAVDDNIVLQITALLNDPDASVSEAAEDALLRLRRTQRRGELLRALDTERNRDERWPLIDLAIAVGDAGDDSVGFPDPVVAACAQLDWPMSNYVAQELQETQKKQKEALQSISQKKQR